VVIADELGARTLQAAAYRALGRRSRLVVWAKLSEATEQGRGRVRPVLRRALLHLADAVIVNGASGARYVERLGTEAGKVFRVPQTTNIASFLALPAQREAFIRHRLIYCGRLIQLKGLIPFVSHLSNLARDRPEQHIELWFAGDGPLRSELAQFPRPANLHFRFLGSVPYERLPEIYGQAGILVFPTLADEWGLVVVEAMASGLPVLGSLYSQAVEDLVTDGLNGWTFRPDDFLSLRSALDRALGAPAEEIDHMGRQARNRVKDLTPESMTRQIMAAIEYAHAHDS
jgi:glycosyltransferase involved in cell wall biosynthesis